MRLQNLIPASVVSLAAIWSQQALALDCTEIMNMVNVNVPTNIIVQTIEDSGEKFSADDVRCLTNEGAPEEVVGAVKKMAQASASAPKEDEGIDPGTAPKPKTGSGSSFDQDETLGGSTGGKGGTSLRDIPEEGEGETAEGKDPEKLEDAVTAYNAKKYLTCTYNLQELLQSGSYPDKESKILYYMAQCLYGMQMYHSAQYYYIEVLKKGASNPYFKYALPKLVTIARYTGDETDLMRIVAKIPPEEYPRSARNQLYYLLGLKLYNDDKLNEARSYFEQVSEKSELYTRAQYLEGIIFNKLGKLKSAVRSFTAVARAKNEAVTAQELDELLKLRDLSLMNIGRIYYGIEQFENANTYYGYVPRESAYWPTSMFESAWTNFMLTDLNLTLGQLLTISSPYYAENEFIPEALILRALTYFQLCQYKDIERVVAQFDAQYLPVHEEMKLFLQQYSTEESRKLTDQAYDHYFGREAADTKIPKSYFVKLLRNQEFGGLVDHLNLLDREVALIEEQKTQWKDGVGTQLLKIIADDRERLKQRAGRVMLSDMAATTNYLGNLITQSKIIKFEVTNANYDELSQRAQGVTLKSENDKPVDFAQSRDKIFWPFNWEFWQDELGYYRFTEHSQCRK